MIICELAFPSAIDANSSPLGAFTSQPRFSAADQCCSKHRPRRRRNHQFANCWASASCTAAIGKSLIDDCSRISGRDYSSENAHVSHSLEWGSQQLAVN